MSALEKVGVVTLSVLFGAPLMFAITLYSAFAGGYVAAQIWSWHILPLGLGLPALGWKQFWAIGAVSRMCFGWKKPKDEPKKDNSTKVAEALVAVAAPWLVLAFAWWLKP